MVGGTAPGPGVDVILQSDVELRARMALSGHDSAAGLQALPVALLRATLNAIVGEHLIAREARRVQAASPSRADVERERRLLVRSAGGSERLQRVLRAFGVPASEIDVIARRRALVGAFLSANIEGATVVTEAELERAYDSERDAFAGRERAEALTELRARLSGEALARTIERWVTVLRARTPTRIYVDY